MLINLNINPFLHQVIWESLLIRLDLKTHNVASTYLILSCWVYLTCCWVFVWLACDKVRKPVRNCIQSGRFWSPPPRCGYIFLIYCFGVSMVILSTASLNNTAALNKNGKSMVHTNTFICSWLEHKVKDKNLNKFVVLNISKLFTFQIKFSKYNFKIFQLSKWKSILFMSIVKTLNLIKNK